MCLVKPSQILKLSNKSMGGHCKKKKKKSYKPAHSPGRKECAPPAASQPGGGASGRFWAPPRSRWSGAEPGPARTSGPRPGGLRREPTRGAPAPGAQPPGGRALRAPRPAPCALRLPPAPLPAGITAAGLGASDQRSERAAGRARGAFEGQPPPPARELPADFAPRLCFPLARKGRAPGPRCAIWARGYGARPLQSVF